MKRVTEYTSELRSAVAKADADLKNAKEKRALNT
jgi:hypothetical protein